MPIVGFAKPFWLDLQKLFNPLFYNGVMVPKIKVDTERSCADPKKKELFRKFVASPVSQKKKF